MVRNNGKIKMCSPDFTTDNINNLAILFPNCVTERQRENQHRADIQTHVTSYGDKENMKPRIDTNKHKLSKTVEDTEYTEVDFESLVGLFEQTQTAMQSQAARSVDIALVVRNWLFGWYIVEYQQHGTGRADYGKGLLKNLSTILREKLGKGFSVDSIELMRKFYLGYTKIWQTLSAKFSLSWSHYVVLLTIKSFDERRFYEIEAIENAWGIRELKRQISSSLYERLALSRDKQKVKELSEKGQLVSHPSDVLKSPYILEFFGLNEHSSYSEHELETAIIDKIEHFLLELGKGFLFEARQKRFSFDDDHFYVDLVFYNRLLRCYVIIDLKRDKLIHQDLGQMQMYVNYFDRYVKLEDEKPTVGILLCHSKDDRLVEITLPEGSNIHASEYQLYLPSKEELKKQLEEAQQDWEINHPGLSDSSKDGAKK
jgi:predicted nuclease of restriction endonuclease-like (RecB) superfamily